MNVFKHTGLKTKEVSGRRRKQFIRAFAHVNGANYRCVFWLKREAKSNSILTYVKAARQGDRYNQSSVRKRHKTLELDAF